MNNKFIFRSVIAAVAIAVMFVGFLPHASAQIYANLSEGSTGAEVTALQQYLARDSAIYPEGLVTGYYGSLTTSAVMRFQAKYGISQTGTVGPLTRAQLNLLFTGGGAPAGSVGDINAPVMSGISVSRFNNALTLNWFTNEAATTKIYYGTTYPFLYGSAPTVFTPGYTLQHSVTIPNLNSNSTYYYMIESVDASGNVTWTTTQPAATL